MNLLVFRTVLNDVNICKQLPIQSLSAFLVVDRQETNLVQLQAYGHYLQRDQKYACV
jgi:hypothetical protein